MVKSYTKTSLQSLCCHSTPNINLAYKSMIRYFGKTPAKSSSGNCDNAISHPREVLKIRSVRTHGGSINVDLLEAPVSKEIKGTPLLGQEKVFIFV